MIIDRFPNEINSSKELEEIKMNHLDDLMLHSISSKEETLLKQIDTIGNTIKVYYKPSDNLSIEEKEVVKNILLIGETGVGKSTFINSFTTFLSGIQIYSNFRIIMVQEIVESQIKSVTSEVNTYIIRPKENIFYFPIRLIDTPGFGDTNGDEVKKRI